MLENVECKLNFVKILEILKKEDQRRFFKNTYDSNIPVYQIFSFDGVDFESAASTKCEHQWGGLAYYEGLALTTGSYSNSSCHVRSELYNFKTNQ